MQTGTGTVLKATDSTTTVSTRTKSQEFNLITISTSVVMHQCGCILFSLAINSNSHVCGASAY